MNYLSYLCNLDKCIAIEGKILFDTGDMLHIGFTGCSAGGKSCLSTRQC